MFGIDHVCRWPQIDSLTRCLLADGRTVESQKLSAKCYAVEMWAGGTALRYQGNPVFLARIWDGQITCVLYKLGEKKKKKEKKMALVAIKL